MLKGISGVYVNQSFPMSEGELVFGRNPSSCNIVFQDSVRGISKMHCMVENNGKIATLKDLGSSYGTFLNGVKIQQHLPIVLKNGDTFCLGDKSNAFIFQGLSAVGSAVPITYLNSNAQLHNQGDSKIKTMIMMGVIVISVVIVGVVISISFASVKSAENAQQQVEYEKQQAEIALEEEENKGILGNLLDAGEQAIEKALP